MSGLLRRNEIEILLRKLCWRKGQWIWRSNYYKHKHEILNLIIFTNLTTKYRKGCIIHQRIWLKDKKYRSQYPLGI